MYGPAGVFGFTSTLPVAGSNISCDGTVDPVATVIVEFVGVAVAPLMVSPVKALRTAVAPDVPLMPEIVSGDATTGPAIVVTKIVAVLQLVGLSFSQI